MGGKTLLLGLFIILLGISFSYIIFAQSENAGGAPQTSITFPIAELGSCASQDECRAYCNDTEHIDACTAFASAHGLVNQDEVKSAKLFKETLLTNGGPGGCKSPTECAAVCGDLKNIEACVSFAKEHGLKGGDLKAGEKVSAYIKSGGVMPGDCDSKQSCETYCKDLSHAKECRAFALKVGFVGRGEGDSASSLSTIQKLADLASRGETPGGCKTKDECRSYCQDDVHRDECLAFGEKVGFIKHDEAQKFRDLGGKGPGGCASRDACEAYCNDPAHRDECFQFAKDHGLISSEGLQNAKEGLAHLREGLANAPSEVAACIKSTIGEEAVGDIESGQVTPGADTTGKVRDCFNKFGHGSGPLEILKRAPKEVAACIKDKLGDRFQVLAAGTDTLTPEEADGIRVCFGKQNFINGGGQDGQDEKREGSGMPNFKKFLQDAPAELKSCVESTLGIKLDSVDAGTAIDTSKLRSCFDSFRPKPMGEGEGGNGARGPGSDFQPSQNSLRNIPENIKACLQEKLGVGFDTTQSAGPSPELKAAMQACAGELGAGNEGNQFNIGDPRGGEGGTTGTPPFRDRDQNGRQPFEGMGPNGSFMQGRPPFGQNPQNPLDGGRQFENRPLPTNPGGSNDFKPGEPREENRLAPPTDLPRPTSFLNRLLGSVIDIFSSPFRR